jgi:predicted nucleic acid-binding protein
MRVIVDTNVVVSAILRDRLPEKILLFIIARPDFEWVASGEILAEWHEPT